MVNRCERPIQSAQKCPLCAEELLPNRLQRHLGKHLQQVALFVLPRPEINDENLGSEGALGGSRDEGTGSKSELEFATISSVGSSEQGAGNEGDPASTLVDSVNARDEETGSTSKPKAAAIDLVGSRDEGIEGKSEPEPEPTSSTSPGDGDPTATEQAVGINCGTQ